MWKGMCRGGPLLLANKGRPPVHSRHAGIARHFGIPAPGRISHLRIYLAPRKKSIKLTRPLLPMLIRMNLPVRQTRKLINSVGVGVVIEGEGVEGRAIPVRAAGQVSAIPSKPP